MAGHSNFLDFPNIVLSWITTQGKRIEKRSSVQTQVVHPQSWEKNARNCNKQHIRRGTCDIWAGFSKATWTGSQLPWPALGMMQVEKKLQGLDRQGATMGRMEQVDGLLQFLQVFVAEVHRRVPFAGQSLPHGDQIHKESCSHPEISKWTRDKGLSELSQLRVAAYSSSGNADATDKQMPLRNRARITASSVRMQHWHTRHMPIQTRHSKTTYTNCTIMWCTHFALRFTAVEMFLG